MAWVFNLLYLAILVAASPWLAWRAWRQGKNRTGWSQKFFGFRARSPANRPRVWMHAVSVGEVNLLGPIIAELERIADVEILISVSTETGFALAQKKFMGRQLFYFPFDFTWSVRGTIESIDPVLIVLVELELWPNLLATAEQHNVPVAVVNARLGERSARGYARRDWLARRLFPKLSLVLAQSATSADRFMALGTPTNRVHVTGNVKFDNIDPAQAQGLGQKLAQWSGIELSHFVLVGGSTQPDENEMLLSAFHKLREEIKGLRLVLVPRHPHVVPDLEALLRSQSEPYLLRSRLAAGDSIKANPPAIVVVDVIGELMAWWTLADVAYVGGSLGSRGGQNMIEPASCGSVVCFGPNTQNFRDVVELFLANAAASVISNPDELCALVRRVEADPVWAAGQGGRAQQLVGQQKGAAAGTVRLLATLLPHKKSSDHSEAA